MSIQNLGTFLTGFGTGIALTTALSGVYCLYIKNKRQSCPYKKTCKCKCEPSVADEKASYEAGITAQAADPNRYWKQFIFKLYNSLKI